MQTIAELQTSQPVLQAVQIFLLPLKVILGHFIPQIFPLLSLNFEGMATDV